jgi:Domain of unknown function (DUF4279)
MMQDRSVGPSSEQIRTFAEFVISGSSSPDAVTKALGIEPDSVQRMGEPVTGSDGSAVLGKGRFNRWALSSAHRTPSHQLEDHLQTLIDVVRPRSEEISCFAGTDRIWFWISWQSDQLFRGTGMILSASVSREVASLGAELDFDLYCTAVHSDSS